MDINNKNLCPSCFTEIAAETCTSCGYSSETVSQYPTALPMGTILMGRYLIGKVLGKGGFGVTYLAYDLNQNKRVAIKEYLPDNLTHRNTGTTEVSTYAGEKGEAFKAGADKFFEEAKTVSKFNGHPNIINVLEFFFENNTAYFVMEYLNGIDLKNYIANNGGRLSEQRTCEIILPVIDALTVIHSVGILHRDISPDNIYICEDGNVKILDFGAARQVLGEQSKSLSVVLKQGFAPIEQYQTRGNQGAWTDIYALGATMYYCLTGRIPESAMDRVDEDNLKTFEELGINVSEKLSSIILKALSVRGISRHQNMLELKAAFINDKADSNIVQVNNDNSRDSADPKDIEEINDGLNKKRKSIFNRKLVFSKKAVIYTSAACIVLIVCAAAFSMLAKGRNNVQANSGRNNISSSPVKVQSDENSSAIQTTPSAAQPSPSPTAAAQTAAPTQASPTAAAKPTSTPTVKPTAQPTNSAASNVVGVDYTLRTAKYSAVCKYTGVWKNDAPNGYGELTIVASSSWKAGDRLKGTFANGLLNGIGSINCADGKSSYNGSFSNGLFNGYGKRIYSTGDIYEGSWVNSVKSGKGTYKWSNGDKYEGDFKDDKPNGTGTCYEADGDKYVGEWKDGMQNGFGTFTWSNGDKYVGEWKNDKANGHGIMTDKDGNSIEGTWVDGKYQR
jgi:serine/threonine protein kinase